MIKNIAHIALAVPCLEQATTLWRNILGAQVSDTQAQPAHGVNVRFVQVGQNTIELLSPINEQSPIAGFFQKHAKGGMHHICLYVNSIEQAQHTLRAQGIRMLSDPKIGAHGNLVLFLHPADCGGVLIELEEKPAYPA